MRRKYGKNFQNTKIGSIKKLILGNSQSWQKNPSHNKELNKQLLQTQVNGIALKIKIKIKKPRSSQNFSI